MTVTSNFEHKLVILVILVVASNASGGRRRRIVGGKDADHGDFSYMASIQESNGKHICGGAIISDRHIVTAAHCVTGFSSVKNLTILVGTSNVNGSGGYKYAVKAVRGHPDFLYDKTSRIVKNDIAVIILKKKIKRDVTFKIVELPKSRASVGTLCNFSGWGKISYPAGDDPDKLQATALKTILNSECAVNLLWNVLESHICTGGRVGVGACLYDSGGPLVCNDVFTAVFTYMIPCGHGYPDLFTRVYSYMDFIDNVTLRN